MVGVRNVFLGWGVTGATIFGSDATILGSCATILGLGGSGVMTLKTGLVTLFPDVTEVRELDPRFLFRDF